MTSAAPSIDTRARGGIRVRRKQRLLVVQFSEVQRCVSWAVVGGGFFRSRRVAWLQVTDGDLRPPVRPAAFLRRKLAAAGLRDAVGLLTSRDLDSYVDVSTRYGSVAARCITTVGLGNALRAGDPPGPIGRIGTINVLCHVSVALSDEARLEALALAAEARALAVREAEVPSRRSGEPASGTGTDCIVVAAPETGAFTRYAGKHTSAGHVIGASVRAAVSLGIGGCRRS